MPITTSPKVSPFCLLMGLAVCTTKAYCAGTICSAFPQHTWSSHSARTLERCTSIGCVHHKGVLCWHNLQRTSIFSHCFGMQLVTCMSAEHEVNTNWRDQLGDCGSGATTCTSAAGFAGTFLQLGVCAVTEQKRDTHLRTVGHLSSTGSLSCHIRFAVMPHQFCCHATLDPCMRLWK